MNRSFNEIIILIIIVLGAIGFALEFLIATYTWVPLLLGVIEIAILALFVLEFLMRGFRGQFRLKFFRRNLFDLLLLVFIVSVIIIQRLPFGLSASPKLRLLSLNLIVVRYFVYIFYFIKLYARNQRLNEFYKKMTTRPAVTVVFSFLIVIVGGTFFLMMPFSASDGVRVSFINALFTSTSAVCVTGLTVLDTATRFSLYGQLVILILIQIGGLGLMIMTYFAAFVVGKRVSFEERMAISYLMNEQDSVRITAAIVKIIFLTFAIETIGAMLLFRYFQDYFGDSIRALIFAVFHSVSAFCNAGFALFTDSFTGFKSSIFFNVVICSLIILGGLSFSVLSNLFENFFSRIRNAILIRKSRRLDLTMNTRAVLMMTGILIITGMLLIYGLEHGRQLLALDLKTQYLSAFFQSVTLRTAGFNTLDFSKFRDATLLIMVAFMFIGGATGSTAGGVKVNTVFIIYAYIRSLIRGERDTVILKHSLRHDTISRAFLITILSILFVFTGTLILTVSEPFSLSQILFEEVSAFGTVGLSTGITSKLSLIGKLIIIITMFIGRIGTLTLMVAIFQRGHHLSNVRYPEGEIMF